MGKCVHILVVQQQSATFQNGKKGQVGGLLALYQPASLRFIVSKKQ